MNLLQAEGITKRFPGVVALDKVSLTVRSGEVHCIVGENGAGKSTLVKVLTGIYRADEGRLLIEGKETNGHASKAIALVPQELNLFDNLTVAENIFLPFDHADSKSLLFNRKECEKNARAHIDELQMEVSPGDLVKNISVAERQLLQVARALANKSFKVLILDEPTASLTKREIDRLFGVIAALKAQGKSIIFITHRLDEVMHLQDAVTVLRNGMVVGNSENADVSEDWIVKQMSGKDIDLSTVYRPRRPAGNEILSVQDLTGERFEKVSFSLREGEILGVAGLVGAGRSEIMQTIFGYLPRRGGQVLYQGQPWRFGDPSYSIGKGVIYLSEERKTHGIFPNLSIRQNVGVGLLKKLSKAGMLDESSERETTQRVIRSYNVKAPSSETKIVNLSGGNQQKVLIGRSLEAAPRVLFLDEPTRGIDVNAKDEIYALMRAIAEEKRMGIVLISSELEELLKCSNRVITIYNGRVRSELNEGELSMEAILSSVIGATQTSAA
ncbi:sugar ABC transporter ATP-binding protein [Microvirga sp. GCM10011540]|uniref:sugar ABC transporter ATP-binding protein n=1 Tax=Microvirga sp. GCM10011540 TaxID=3317338 RepID=UPI003616CE7F